MDHFTSSNGPHQSSYPGQHTIGGQRCLLALLSVATTLPHGTDTGHPQFPPGLQNTNFQGLVMSGRLHLCDFVGPDGQLPPLLGCLLQTLCWTSGVVSFIILSVGVCRFRSYLASSLNTSVAGGGGRRSHTVFRLTCQAEGFVPLILSKWETDLGTQFNDSQKEKILYSVQKSSIASRVQETCYKILTRWYRVPTTLHSFFPQVPSLCW